MGTCTHRLSHRYKNALKLLQVQISTDIWEVDSSGLYTIIWASDRVCACLCASAQDVSQSILTLPIIEGLHLHEQLVNMRAHVLWLMFPIFFSYVTWCTRMIHIRAHIHTKVKRVLGAPSLVSCDVSETYQEQLVTVIRTSCRDAM
jgi:hypothetical protein